MGESQGTSVAQDSRDEIVNKHYIQVMVGEGSILAIPKRFGEYFRLNSKVSGRLA